MKNFLMILLIIHHSLFIHGQEIPLTTEQQFENLTEVDQNETEDDSYLQQLQHFKKHPLNLNEADASELEELIFLNAFQIEKFIAYRRLLGKLISIYELQAIPGWDIITIKKILPYVFVGESETLEEKFFKRLKNGKTDLLLRISQVLERSKGFDKTTAGKYLGSPQRIFFRYRYQFKDLLQYGILGDKDAGEPFFKKAQKFGFDFYSFHFFIRKLGRIKALALGDFTVNLGQGLTQWQSLAFKKSTDVLAIKRQSPVIRPYNSAGEFYFHRGVAATVKFGRIEATVFGSARKLSANLVEDTINNEDFISSFLSSGYHRTENEIGGKNILTQLSTGANLSYSRGGLHAGINAVFYRFSLPVQKKNEPYNFYAIQGRRWNNMSIDYSYTFRNLYIFGEAAVDKNFNTAFLNGVLISVDPCVDVSFLQRSISKAYQAVYGNAFTENSSPSNEEGLFIGISVRPVAGVRIDGYADIYKFPWLKYLSDAPGYGKDFLLQFTYAPNKQLEVCTRFRTESKQSNQPENSSVTNYLITIPKQNLRLQWSYKINSSFLLRNRVEALWYDEKQRNRENGFLIYADVVYQPLLKPYSANARLQYFETDGYNSRVYAYENDVLYGSSISPFFDHGIRYYVNLNWDMKKNFSFRVRWAQTVYRDIGTIGSGLDEIKGIRRSEVKIQLNWQF